jgi:hypothetical protein
MTIRFDVSAILTDLDIFAEKNNTRLDGNMYDQIEKLAESTEINSDGKAQLINRALTTELCVSSALHKILGTNTIMANEIVRVMKIRDYIELPEYAEVLLNSEK